MVWQIIVRVVEKQGQKPKILVRSKKGNTYPCIVGKGVSITKILEWQHQGLEVKARVEKQHGTWIVEGTMSCPKVHEEVTQEELEQQRLEYIELGGDY